MVGWAERGWVGRDRVGWGRQRGMVWAEREGGQRGLGAEREGRAEGAIGLTLEGAKRPFGCERSEPSC